MTAKISLIKTSSVTSLNRKPPLLPIRKYFVDNSQKFLCETSLNGLKYINDLRRNIWERLYYFISFSLVFASALYMAFYFLQKWRNTPVIISLSATTTQIKDLPFPAITICNMNQARRSKVAGIQSDSPDYAFLQKLCLQDYNYTKFLNYKPRFIGDTFANFLIKHTQSCGDMFVYCKYGPNEEVCTDLFREVLLDEGVCCVFNQLHPFYLYKGDYHFVRDYTSSNGRTTIPVNWSFESGYDLPLPKIYYPRKAAGSGVSMGLTLVLNATLNDYYCSSTNGAGFKLLLYDPIDAPYIKETGLPIMLGYETKLRIDSKLMAASSSLRSASPRDRHCYFANEKSLLYFKHYTRRNCEMECDAKAYLRNCNCLPYHMPLIYANATVCHLNQMNCVLEMENALFFPRTVVCKEECLSGCNELSFYPSAFVTPLSRKDYNLQDEFFRNISKEEMHFDLAMVRIYYDNNYFRGYLKAPYTGLTEFLSQTGGMMGLMVGFSVISVVEIIYFILIKPFLDMILRRTPNMLRWREALPKHTEASFYNDNLHQKFLIKARRPIRATTMNWNHSYLNQYKY